MTKAAFREWVATFLLERVGSICNTPQDSPDDVPLDTILITIDVRSIERTDAVRGTFPPGHHDNDEHFTIIVANRTIDGVTAAERNDDPNGYEFGARILNDEAP